MSYTNLKNAVAGILATAYQTPADAIAELLPDSEEEFDGSKFEAKRNIWMSKLPSLSVEDAHTLASSYEFSGGQIDNIVRKALMQEVIKGEKPTLNSLVTMCMSSTCICRYSCIVCYFSIKITNCACWLCSSMIRSIPIGRVIV